MSHPSRYGVHFKTPEPVPKRAGLIKLSLLALVLSALPLSAIATQEIRAKSGAVLKLPVKLNSAQTHKWVPRLSVTSTVQSIRLNELSGDKSFSPHDPAYVFLARSGGIWYPYAVLGSRPDTMPSSSADTLMLRGNVEAVLGDSLLLSYDFDEISPTRETVEYVLRRNRDAFELELAIDEHGRASVIAIWVEDTRIPQRVTLKGVLDGGSKNGAINAPPT